MNKLHIERLASHFNCVAPERLQSRFIVQHDSRELRTLLQASANQLQATLAQGPLELDELGRRRRKV